MIEYLQLSTHGRNKTISMVQTIVEACLRMDSKVLIRKSQVHLKMSKLQLSVLLQNFSMDLLSQLVTNSTKFSMMRGQSSQSIALKKFRLTLVTENIQF
jgi:hypothetical protein